jgi:hypothetical protein
VVLARVHWCITSAEWLDAAVLGFIAVMPVYMSMSGRGGTGFGNAMAGGFTPDFQQGCGLLVDDFLYGDTRGAGVGDRCVKQC